MNINEKLLKIQIELKAPKGQYNSFGKYKYRSCEDILEAVKPLLQENKCTLTIKDDMEQIGDRYYIKATAILADTEADNTIITNTAYAREEESKKGMDASQITGASSSYARKYALNGLFNIDDTKDSDFTNTKDNQTTAEAQRNYQSEINTYTTLLANNSKQSAEEWVTKAKEKYSTPKGQADVLIKWWNKTNKDKQ